MTRTIRLALIDSFFDIPGDSTLTNREDFVERQEHLYGEAYSVQEHLCEQAQRRKKGYGIRVISASFSVGFWV